MKKKKTVKKRGIRKDSQYFKEYEAFCGKVRQQIIQLRLEKGLTQEEMEEFELNLRQFQRIEGGETKNLTLSYLFRISKALGIKPSKLVDF